MNVHKHARLTPIGRGLAIRRLDSGEAIEGIAAGMGVSVRTLYKWRKRWREEGEAGLLDRSSRPHRSPGRTPRQIERYVLRLRKRSWTNQTIADRVKLPLSTVSSINRRHGLGRLSALEPKIPVVRYEWSRPGEMVHLDIKKLARIERVGHRIHGDRARSVEGAGWEYLHVCVDDASRVSILC